MYVMAEMEKILSELRKAKALLTSVDARLRDLDYANRFDFALRTSNADPDWLAQSVLDVEKLFLDITDLSEGFKDPVVGLGKEANRLKAEKDSKKGA